MENSEVLEQDTNVIPDGKEQKDVAAIDSGPKVIMDTSRNTSGTPSTTQVVAEPDHATEIANNAVLTEEPAVLKQDTTYNYNSQAPKKYDETVTTTTTQSNGSKPISTVWDSEYKMDKGYTVDDSQDYSWNKLAGEMAQLNYDQEAAQYRAESIAAKQELDAAASSAWNNYFAAEYSARQTQEKMGWSGGQEKASDLQVMFLQAETAANMYTQDEMQRYGVESKLSIARMYAEANQRTLALEYYQDAIDNAISEANITGYYVPPEASEMFTQEAVANDIIKDPASTPEAVARAKNVITNCQAYYKNLGFERGTRKDANGKVVTEWFGIKTLALLTHEETVRNNKVNEELQRQANAINQQQANTAWANYKLAVANSEYVPISQNDIESSKVIQKNNIVGTDPQGRNVYYANGKQYVQKGNTVYLYTGKVTTPGTTTSDTKTTTTTNKPVTTITPPSTLNNKIQNGTKGLTGEAKTKAVASIINGNYKNVPNNVKNQYARLAGMTQAEANKYFPIN